jgi:ATP/maltotriose-dependent transcriptional regulator MalT
MKRPYAVKALILAGRSAALADDYALSFTHYEAAYHAATTPSQKFDALWGQLISGNVLERADMEGLLQQLEVLVSSSGSDDALLRVAMARFNSTCWARKNIRECLQFFRETEHLADRATDPLAVSAYIQTFAYAHILVGEYGAAIKLVDALDRIVQEHDLVFVGPVAGGTRGYAQFGLGLYGEAAATAREVEGEAIRIGDDHSVLNARHIKARILLASGEFNEALRVAALPTPGRPSKAMVGEILATKALAHACLHDWGGARESLRQARLLTRSLETEGMAIWTETVAAVLKQSPQREKVAAVAADYLTSTGYVDAFVAAVRACPRLAGALPAFEQWLGSCPHAVLPPIMSPEDVPALSRRETEVARLIAAGLTNREIAAALVISEATVKVHVRHILEKLHARSRAEVASRLLIRDLTRRHDPLEPA